ncbi:MAG: DUF1540 domain-containing protein [Clostridiales bacterium]|nr:DUF1540 domain-containing protein [Clostridiales bacterium]
MASQEIQCRVQTCKYNDNGKECSLNNIVVGNCGSQAHDKQGTECDSFVAQ